MCKLSLWLVSLDPKLPFSFVDDKILCGNSLLGLTSARQLEALHIDPEKAPRATSLFDLDVEDVLRRRGPAARTTRHRSRRRRPTTLRHHQTPPMGRLPATHRPTPQVADGVIAAGLKLGGKPGKALDDAYQHLRMAVADAYPAHGGVPDPTARQIIDEGLTPTVPTDYDRWRPLHWILAVPDVMESGGFDAIIGNPPFLGGKKISTANGTNIRDWFVNASRMGLRGTLISSPTFFLRAMTLLGRRGTLGLIATNTIAQGDTREVGSGPNGRRRIYHHSRDPKSLVAGVEREPGVRRRVGHSRLPCSADPTDRDDLPVSGISTLLEAAGRSRDASAAGENAGSGVHRLLCPRNGFILDVAVEAQMDRRRPAQRRGAVPVPKRRGPELQSRLSPSRWVIDFNDQRGSHMLRSAPFDV